MSIGFYFFVLFWGGGKRNVEGRIFGYRGRGLSDKETTLISSYYFEDDCFQFSM